MLIKAGLNDSRVPYWESGKWASRLRELKDPDDKSALLLLIDDGGHFSYDGLEAEALEAAKETAFLIDFVEK